MKKTENLLDERQEQTMLKIEHYGFWLAFWGLLVAMIVQSLISGLDPKALVGEWIIFMVLAIYVAAACAKNGIWDRRLKPNNKTNALLSLIAGLVVGVVLFVKIFRESSGDVVPALVTGLLALVVCFVLCFIAISVSARAFNKKQAALEAEPEEELAEEIEAEAAQSDARPS